MPDLAYSEIEFADTELYSWQPDAERTDALIASEILSRELGDNWLDRHTVDLRSASPWQRPVTATTIRDLPVLQFPSAIIRQEWNYLINPQHPEYSAIVWSRPQRFQLDARLIDPGLR